MWFASRCAQAGRSGESKAFLSTPMALLPGTNMASRSRWLRVGCSATVQNGASIPTLPKVCARTVRACLRARCYRVSHDSSLRRLAPRFCCSGCGDIERYFAASAVAVGCTPLVCILREQFGALDGTRGRADEHQASRSSLNPCRSDGAICLKKPQSIRQHALNEPYACWLISQTCLYAQ